MVVLPAPGPRLVPRAEWCGGRCWILLGDCCGVFCALFTYVLVFGVAFVTDVYYLWPRLQGTGWSRWQIAHAAAYNGLVLLLAFTHLRCMCTNPGTARDYLEEGVQAVMRKEYDRCRTSDDPGLRSQAGYSGRRKWWCVKCSTYRPRKTHHCSSCKTCVLDMDHHCPWVNNCVGWRNHKFFLLFLMYAWLACLWSFVVLVYAMMNPALAAGWTEAEIRKYSGLRRFDFKVPQAWVQMTFGTLQSSFTARFFGFVCVIASLIVMIFISVMGCDQWDYLSHDTGAVDKKMEERKAAAAEAEKSLGAEASAEKDGLAEVSSTASTATPSGSDGEEHAGMPPILRCCERIGCLTCKRLPVVMGARGPFGFSWLVPLAQGRREVFHAPQDIAVQRARENLAEAAKQKGPGAASAAAKSNGDAAKPQNGKNTSNSTDGRPAALKRDEEPHPAQELRMLREKMVHLERKLVELVDSDDEDERTKLFTELTQTRLAYRGAELMNNSRRWQERARGASERAKPPSDSSDTWDDSNSEDSDESSG